MNIIVIISIITGFLALWTALDFFFKPLVLDVVARISLVVAVLFVLANSSLDIIEHLIVTMTCLVFVVRSISKPSENLSVFRGKTVIITGASSGVGKEMVYLLAQNGANLLITARRKGYLEEIAHECTKFDGGGTVNIFACDLIEHGSAHAIVKRCISLYDHIDCIILNAGSWNYELFKSYTKDKRNSVLKDSMNGNFLSHAIIVSEALEYLEARNGRIIAVSSWAGRITTPYVAEYTASKKALQGFLDCLRLELGSTSPVSITIAYLGLIKTKKALDTVPNKVPILASGEGMMESSQCAKLILHAGAARKRDVSVPGVGGPVIRLAGLLPELFDWCFSFMIGSKNT